MARALQRIPIRSGLGSPSSPRLQRTGRTARNEWKGKEVGDGKGSEMTNGMFSSFSGRVRKAFALVANTSAPVASRYPQVRHRCVPSRHGLNHQFITGLVAAAATRRCDTD